MRTKRFRFTVAAMMIAVAIAAMGFGAAATIRRREREFQARRTLHLAQLARLIRRHHHGDLGRYVRMQEHEVAMIRKYDRAARYPWLPVAADPPGPK